jgi:hypothetical protein
MADRISHAGSQCKNIKSKKQASEQCKNVATHGDYCGIHYKKPVPFGMTVRKVRKLNKLSLKKIRDDAARRLGHWIASQMRHRKVRIQGVGLTDRHLLANDADFFSTESLRDLSGLYFFSYIDGGQVYGFDIRSVHTLISRTDATPTNPYTRTPIPERVLEKIRARVTTLQKLGHSTVWIPLEPPTPEQQWRMRVVDLFAKIDELNYYSSPDWFIELTQRQQRQFYRELQTIWSYRAGLSDDQKESIVPDHAAALFTTSPWLLIDLTEPAIRRLNMNTIRVLVTSAEDRQDRILGAMYVVSALTLVSDGARREYPWLHESVYEPPVPRNIVYELPATRFDWIHRLFGVRGDPIPLLELPPSHE